MKRFLFPVLLGAVALLAPGRSLAQDKPVLNTAPPGSAVPAPATPAPTTPASVEPAPVPVPAPVYTPTPVVTDPTPSPYNPSGLELPKREQDRKAAEQHAEQFTKLFVYSGIGLGYSGYSDYSVFNFSISPAIGYRITDKLSVGPGISYAYNNYGFPIGNNQTYHISSSNFGVKAFAQLLVYKQFFAHAEFESTKAELLEVDNFGYYTGYTVKRTVQTPLLGAGYRSQISNRIAADILLLYNFQDNYNSIYSNPVIRFNFLINIGR